MLTTILYLFAFVVVLSLVVVIHEGGHFMAARWCGVHVTDFSIGFGKELWHHVDKKGTRWKVCLVPLGGYVKMLGDEDAASARSSTKNVQTDMIRYTFMAQSLWKRAIIIFAGPAMNYISAIVFLTGLMFFFGEVKIPPVIGEIIPDTPAFEAGLQKGDTILSINGESVEEFMDIQRVVRVTAFNEPLLIQVDRNGEQKKFSLLPRVIDDSNFPIIGVRPSSEVVYKDEHVGFVRSFKMAVYDVYRMTADTLIYLGQVLFKNRPAKDMRGPLGIAEASGDAMQGGFFSLLLFIAQISVAVGLMNLLPIPMLDGGHLAFYAVEAVRGKPLSEKTQNGLLLTGLGLLCLLLLYTIFLDVPRIVQRVQASREGTQTEKDLSAEKTAETQETVLSQGAEENSEAVDAQKEHNSESIAVEAEKIEGVAPVREAVDSASNAINEEAVSDDKSDMQENNGVIPTLTVEENK